MDLHNISVGDIVITSANEEAKVKKIRFCQDDLQLYFDRNVTGWIGRDPDYEWYYRYDGKFVTSDDDYRNVANIVKVVQNGSIQTED